MKAQYPWRTSAVTLVYLLPLIKCNKNGTGSLSDNVSLQTVIQTLKNGLKCVANQEIFNVWSKSHMCLGCLFWKQWEKCTSLILQSIILNFGKHFWYVLNLITSCGNFITNFVKMSIWIISIVLNLLNFSKYFQLYLTTYKCYFKDNFYVKHWYKVSKAVLKSFSLGLNPFCIQTLVNKYKIIWCSDTLVNHLL